MLEGSTPRARDGDMPGHPTPVSTASTMARAGGAHEQQTANAPQGTPSPVTKGGGKGAKGGGKSKDMRSRHPGRALGDTVKTTVNPDSSIYPRCQGSTVEPEPNFTVRRDISLPNETPQKFHNVFRRKHTNADLRYMNQYVGCGGFFGCACHKFVKGLSSVIFRPTVKYPNVLKTTKLSDLSAAQVGKHQFCSSTVRYKGATVNYCARLNNREADLIRGDVANTNPIGCVPIGCCGNSGTYMQWSFCVPETLYYAVVQGLVKCTQEKVPLDQESAFPTVTRLLSCWMKENTMELIGEFANIEYIWCLVFMATLEAQGRLAPVTDGYHANAVVDKKRRVFFNETHCCGFRRVFTPVSTARAGVIAPAAAAVVPTQQANPVPPPPPPVNPTHRRWVDQNGILSSGNTAFAVPEPSAPAGGGDTQGVSSGGEGLTRTTSSPPQPGQVHMRPVPALCYPPGLTLQERRLLPVSYVDEDGTMYFEEQGVQPDTQYGFMDMKPLRTKPHDPDLLNNIRDGITVTIHTAEQRDESHLRGFGHPLAPDYVEGRYTVMQQGPDWVETSAALDEKDHDTVLSGLGRHGAKRTSVSTPDGRKRFLRVADEIEEIMSEQIFETLFTTEAVSNVQGDKTPPNWSSATRDKAMEAAYDLDRKANPECKGKPRENGLKPKKPLRYVVDFKPEEAGPGSNIFGFVEKLAMKCFPKFFVKGLSVSQTNLKLIDFVNQSKAMKARILSADFSKMDASWEDYQSERIVQMCRNLASKAADLCENMALKVNDASDLEKIRLVFKTFTAEIEKNAMWLFSGCRGTSIQNRLCVVICCGAEIIRQNPEDGIIKLRVFLNNQHSHNKHHKKIEKMLNIGDGDDVALTMLKGVLWYNNTLECIVAFREYGKEIEPVIAKPGQNCVEVLSTFVYINNKGNAYRMIKFLKNLEKVTITIVRSRPHEQENAELTGFELAELATALGHKAICGSATPFLGAYTLAVCKYLTLKAEEKGYKNTVEDPTKPPELKREVTTLKKFVDEAEGYVRTAQISYEVAAIWCNFAFAEPDSEGNVPEYPSGYNNVVLANALRLAHEAALEVVINDDDYENLPGLLDRLNITTPLAKLFGVKPALLTCLSDSSEPRLGAAGTGGGMRVPVTATTAKVDDNVGLNVVGPSSAGSSNDARIQVQPPGTFSRDLLLAMQRHSLPTVEEEGLWEIAGGDEPLEEDTEEELPPPAATY